MLRAVLLSTYDLGRQPFGLASPAAWLRREGIEVTCCDLAVDTLDRDAVRVADLIGVYLPMHTATRVAVRTLETVRTLNPSAHVCAYGLYAPMNESYLRGIGVRTVLGGEFEAGLVHLARRVSAGGGAAEQSEPGVSHERLTFIEPDRAGLPELSRYATVVDRTGKERVVGATEASRGCKHRCRHCPVVPVYDGRFRIVQRDVVLADVAQQVEAGATHITFGDPDFFNGIGHALPLVRELHRAHPNLTYDVTIKVEHLLQHVEHLATLRDTGCMFVTSAVESVDDRILGILDKGHTRADVIDVVRRFREADLHLNPTFVAFTPWIDVDGYRDLLDFLEEWDLAEHVAPIQLAIRLLIPAGSRLLELPEVRSLAGAFDEALLVHPWTHPDARVDALQAGLQQMVEKATTAGESRLTIFDRAVQMAATAAGHAGGAMRRAACRSKRARVPYLTEPWYC